MLWKDPSGSQRATMPEWSKGHDSSSCGFGRVGSNPTRSSFFLGLFMPQRPGMRRGASRLSAADDSGPQGPLPWEELAQKLTEGIAEWAADTADADTAASSCAFSCAVLGLRS